MILTGFSSLQELKCTFRIHIILLGSCIAKYLSDGVAISKTSDVVHIEASTRICSVQHI